MTDLRLGNGLLRVERVHTSKRGKTYKRRRVVSVGVDGPTWFRAAMMKLRWLAK
jgi:hypothetical protein